MQPDTAAEGDSSINTKKGFLISLPSRKKKDSGEQSSGIVMAKTGGGEKNDPKPPKPAIRDGARDSYNKNARDAQKDAAPKNNPAKETKENADRSKNSNPQRRDRPQKNNANNSAKNNDRAARPERPDSPKNGKERDNREPNREPNNNNRHPKPERTAQNGQNAQNAQNNQNNSNNRNNSDRPKNAPKNDVRPGKNGRGKGAKNNPNDRGAKNPNVQNAQNGQNGQNNANRRDRRQPKMASLSPLSGDMMAFARDLKDDFNPVSAKKAEKEPSLEEKYKDAIPLAEQIAAEEEKRLARVRARTAAAVSHKPMAEAEKENELSAENGETVPEDHEIVGIRFREAGKIYYFDPAGQNIPYGTPVIVETSRGSEYGYTAISNRMVPGGSVVAPLKKIKRIANTADTEKFRANKELETEAAAIFKKKVAELKLAMNLVFVEYTFDNSKLLFYFTAETRIDFRELVKELASVFRTRIELRQIGVRDEAKMLGGIGVCGRCVCCNSFLGDFAQVSIKMAKEQGLSLNSAKISGACGKLMCCLRFEDKVYSEETARTPKVGTVVETAEGRGTVIETNPLKGEIKVSLENASDTPPKTFNRDDVKVVGFHEKTAAAMEAKKEEQAEENRLRDEIVSEMETDAAEELLQAETAPDTER